MIKEDPQEPQDDEEVFAYSNLLADGENISKLKHDAHQAKSNAKNKVIAEAKKPVKLNEKDEDDAIADYSDSLVDQGQDEDSHGGFSLAEKLLDKSSGKDTDDLSDDSEVDTLDQKQSKDHKQIQQSEEEKQNIKFWADQDPDGTKAKQMEKKKKEEDEKKKMEEQEKLEEQKFNNLSDQEKERLRHEALQQASQELSKKSGKRKGTHFKQEELTDLEDTEGAEQDWEGADQYAQYMSQTESKADQNSKKKELKKKQKKKPSKEELKKKADQKAFDEDIESVQTLYDKENQKENDLYQKAQDLHKKDESKEVKEPKQIVQVDQESVAQVDSSSENLPKETEKEDKKETDQNVNKNEGKSLLEEIWEQKHPDEVKKFKEAEEQKQIAKKAKELQEQAFLLEEKSKALKALASKKNSTKKNKTKKVTKKEIEQKKQDKEDGKSVDELLAEGKSLGEIQNTLQMRKPYWKEQQKAQEERDQQSEIQELNEFAKDPFKDPDHDLIEQYANEADERKKQEEQEQKKASLKAVAKANQTKNATNGLIKTSSKNVNVTEEIISHPPPEGENGQGSPGPKKEPEPKIPEHGQELKDAPSSGTSAAKPDKEQSKQKTAQQDAEISEADINEMMSNAIEQKKQAKFDHMIEKGSKIAKANREKAIDNLVESTEKQKGSANQKLTMALVESSNSDNPDQDDGGIESMEGTKAANDLFTNDLDAKSSQSVVQQGIDADVEATIAQAAEEHDTEQENMINSIAEQEAMNADDNQIGKNLISKINAVADQKQLPKQEALPAKPTPPKIKVLSQQSKIQPIKSLDVPVSKPTQGVDSKLEDMAQKLGFQLTPDMMSMGDNEQIQEALMQSAMDAGKTADEVAALLA